jgi:hypothetical protein
MTPARPFAAAVLPALLCACAPQATPPPPPPDTREIEERRETPDPDRTGPLGIPEVQLPAPGECRVWYPGRPAGQQPPPQSCGEAERDAPAGTWVLYHPEDDERVVHRRVIDPARQGVILRVDIYDAERGTYLGTKPVEE